VACRLWRLHFCAAAAVLGRFWSSLWILVIRSPTISAGGSDCRRRACRIIGADRTAIRYRSKRKTDERARARLRELAHERRRFGYRRLHVLLKAEGLVVNRKKTERLYREEGLKVRRRRGRRRAIGNRAPIPVIARPNARWSLDFVHDQFVCGRRFRVLVVVDDVTKECLAAIPDVSLSGRRVIRELDALIAARGRPETIVSDNVLSSERSTGCGQNPSIRRFRRRQGLRPQICRAASAHKRRSLSTITNAGCARQAGAPHRP
jgi:transposase InsO family protein